MLIISIFIYDPAVWGTVSDWFTVLVTGMTGIAIFLTLRGQNQILKMEKRKFQQAQMPVFKVVKIVDQTVFQGSATQKLIHVYMNISLENNNAARNIKIKCPNPAEWESQSESSYDTFYPGFVIPISVKKTVNVAFKPLSATNINLKPLAERFLIVLDFDDELGNHYRQIITYGIYDDKETFRITSPVLYN